MKKIENLSLKSWYIGIFYIFLLTQITNFVYSQNISWQRVYPCPLLNSNFRTIDVCKSDSGNFFLINNILSGFPKDNSIIKINGYGDTIWNKYIDSFYIWSAVSSLNGSCVVVAVGVGTNRSISKIDQNGNIIWSNVFNYTGGPNKIIKNSANCYLVCGYDYPPNAFIIEFDSLGNIIWQKHYPGPYRKFYNSICEANNGGYIAVGYIIVSNLEYGVIDRIDSSGNFIWEKTFTQNGSGTVFYAIDKCPDGYIVGGQARDSSAKVGGMYIVKIDSSGNSVFRKFISTNDTNSFFQFMDLSTINNNKIIVYGGFSDYINFLYPKLIILDLIGNVIDSNTIPVNFSAFYRGITINNSEFIAVGEDWEGTFDMGYAIRCDTNLKIPPIGIKKIAKNVPESFKLFQNYPNPFNPRTIINYQLPGFNYVKLVVFDIIGQEIITLVNEKQTSGKHSVEFNGINLSSGIYFYSLIINDEIIESKKMILLK